MSKPDFSFLCFSIFRYGCMFSFVLQYYPRDWLGRVSVNRPILCPVRCETLVRSVSLFPVWNVDVDLRCRLLCIRSGPASGIHVYVQSSSPDTDGVSAERRTSYMPPTLQSTDAAGIRGPWREINLACTDGRNFAQKLEAIMSCLMPDRTAADATV